MFFKHRQFGFTLVELVASMSIIGIIASIVTSSLNTTRDKTNDTKIKSSLGNMREYSELFFSNEGTYDGFCDNGKVNQALLASDINATSTCVDGANGWALESKLSNGNYFCTDFSGYATVTEIAGLSIADFACANNTGTSSDTYVQNDSTPQDICGNEVKVGGEECDDGNIESGDGCSSGCLVEECGNGREDYSEECDDGNIESGDGCDSNCQDEVGDEGEDILGGSCSYSGNGTIFIISGACGADTYEQVVTPMAVGGASYCVSGNYVANIDPGQFYPEFDLGLPFDTWVSQTGQNQVNLTCPPGF